MVQEFWMDWPECGWNGKHPSLLSSFADAQDDTGSLIRLSLPDKLMVQYVGING